MRWPRGLACDADRVDGRDGDEVGGRRFVDKRIISAARSSAGKIRIPRPHLVEARTMRLPRIRLSLSLRTLLLLILVVALWLGWRVDKARRQRHAIAQVEKYNGYVRFDYEYAQWQGDPERRTQGAEMATPAPGRRLLPRGEPGHLRGSTAERRHARPADGPQRDRGASFPDEACTTARPPSIRRRGLND